MSKLSKISDPNYERTGSVKPLPYEFQREMAERAAQMPAPEMVIGPLMTGCWGIVAASPGVGKSMWMACLIKAIAGKFQRAGEWKAPQRRTVLLVDAEMSPQELSSRYQGADLGDWFGVTSLDLLDRYDRPAFSLGDPIHQEQLFEAAEPFEVIVIDNIEYTLEPADGVNIWSPETWAQVAPITRWAKKNNKLLIFIDHLNKEGGVQGSLSKQRGASFVIKLEPEYVDKADLSFRASFTKLRYVVPPELKRSTLWWYQEEDWWCEIEATAKDKILELIEEGAKQVDIVRETGLSKGYVSKVFRRNKHLREK